MHSTRTILLAGLLLPAAAWSAEMPETPKPPVAAMKPHEVESPHGVRLDEYYWLRDDSRRDPEVLAYLAAEVARQAMFCTGYLPTTATSEWTTFETIGGLQPTPDGLIYRPGLFVDAIESGRWLVIDELNRSNFDRAFGQLFTVLSGQPVVLPFKRKGTPNPLSIVPAASDDLYS